MAERRRLVLDLDGTLIDAERRQCDLARDALCNAGLEESFDAPRFWSLKREGASTRQAFSRLGVAQAACEKAADYWGRHIEAPSWLETDRLLPEVGRTLDWLRQQEIDVYILTARRHEDRVREQVASLGLREQCRDLIVVPVESAAREKAAVLSRLRPLGSVGDSEVDGEAANEANVPFRAVTTGQRSESFLRARGFDSVDSLLEACRLLIGATR